jgi:perosamine synthetase
LNNTKNGTLAINGGNVTLDKGNKHYVWPEITNQTKEAVLKQLDVSISIYNRSGIIERVEKRLAEYFGVKYAVLTNSGTQAIHSMFVGAGFKPGDEIIVPAYTFFATATPLFFTGAKPVLVDCDSNGNLDYRKIEQSITHNTKAIVLTHMWGRPCDMDEIKEIADKYNILVMEDVSHAFGAEYKGEKVGSIGNVAAMSLQGSKTLTGGEGGVLLTNEEEFYYRALLVGHYNKRCKEEIPESYSLSDYKVTGMGMKYRIHPLAAAIIDEQMDRMEEVLQGRREIAKYIANKLSSLNGIEVLEDNENVLSSWYSLIIKYKKDELEGLKIERVYDALKAEGCNEIDRPGSTCALNLHKLFQEPGGLFPNYKDEFSYQPGDFPVAEDWSRNIFKLPVWHKREDLYIVDKYIEAITKVITNYKEL